MSDSGSDMTPLSGDPVRAPPASEIAPARPRRLLPGWFTRWTSTAIVVGVLVLAGGFWWFIGRVPRDEIALDRTADGIVVVTGGASRIVDAVELLSAGRGRRLLISGVHPATTSRELQRLMPEYGQLIACCVDLDHDAINTVGNAVETRLWARTQGFHSLIVVTSNYHMPRAMAELAWHMPSVELIPFPVVTEKMRNESWWNVGAARLLVGEYLKFMFAQVRMRLEAAQGATGAADGRDGA
jgi:uncharacterized SAM-binding protein YcdF (DUF218 family)